MFLTLVGYTALLVAGSIGILIAGFLLFGLWEILLNRLGGGQVILSEDSWLMRQYRKTLPVYIAPYKFCDVIRVGVAATIPRPVWWGIGILCAMPFLILFGADILYYILHPSTRPDFSLPWFLLSIFLTAIGAGVALFSSVAYAIFVYEACPRVKVFNPKKQAAGTPIQPEERIPPAPQKNLDASA